MARILIIITLLNDQLDAQFLFLQYVSFNRLHVSSNIVLIIRRSNCIHTASGIVSLKTSELSKITKITKIQFAALQQIVFY